MDWDGDSDVTGWDGMKETGDEDEIGEEDEGFSQSRKIRKKMVIYPYQEIFILF